ncbi:MAG: large subunit ribosomal protein [Solirubrobacteraceae bacterium]|jgi:large subunit ribosomal protein L21|nr:large subunit ribosomal protein [Solirubrobacteraceae bacterium]
MYAIVKTGGKQYRVEQGQSLLIERLPDEDGASVELEPLLYVDGEDLVDGSDIGRVTVKARILAHERGPKLRIVKFKPKRGYKRRTGHRQDLTRIEVTDIKLTAARRRKAASAAKAEPVAETPATPAPVAAEPVTSNETPEATNGA